MTAIDRFAHAQYIYIYTSRLSPTDRAYRYENEQKRIQLTESRKRTRRITKMSIAV